MHIHIVELLFAVLRCLQTDGKDVKLKRRRHAMTIQIGTNSLETLCRQFDARQVILYEAGALSAYPQLPESEKASWQVYSKLLLSFNQASCLHAFSSSAKTRLVLVQRLTTTAVLLLIYPTSTRIKTLEATHLALRDHLSQPEPDSLTQAVLRLGIDDLKRPAPEPAPKSDPFISIFTDLHKSAPLDTQPIKINK